MPILKARPRFACLAFVATVIGCAAAPRFPLRDPLRQDTDSRSVSVACRREPTEKDPRHVSCAPEPYESPLIWDGLDNLLFRPLAGVFAVDPGGEAINVNSLDEVPDSTWFKNKSAASPASIEQLKLGGCDPSQILDPNAAADGTWIIDKGKGNGSSGGFRITVPGKGKYMFKADPKGQPERPSAASVIGAAVYVAAGFNSSCEQIVYFKPSLLKLTPGLRSKGNFGGEKAFDQPVLDQMLADSPKRGNLVRMQASAWLPGYLIGPFRYSGTRSDDPSDVVPHEDRRDLRGARLVAAWINHFDAREQNSMDSWIADRKDPPDSSPGHVVHYYLDTSEALGSAWDWDEITRRLGHQYIADWGDIALDFVTLGIPTRPWDRAKLTPGRELFWYFDAQNFTPDTWKNEYPNEAFSRMTERDGAWISRVLAGFTPEMVTALAEMAQFSDPGNTTYLASILESRLEQILRRYLTRLSPIGNVSVVGMNSLCGIDLAAKREVRAPESFHYNALFSTGESLPVEDRGHGAICVALPHIAKDGGSADDARDRYVSVTLDDGVAKGPLVARLYDLGPARGYFLAGVERPEN